MLPSVPQMKLKDLSQMAGIAKNFSGTGTNMFMAFQSLKLSWREALSHEDFWDLPT